jgi:hypothetical protein
MDKTGRELTLAAALALHADDRRYLEVHHSFDPYDWDMETLMVEYANGKGDYEYLGQDGETHLAIYGQAEPALQADAALWGMRHAALEEA